MMGAQTLGQKAKSSDAISSALKSIFAVSENYPKLQASENFLELQKQLSAMENQIADRREFYNHSVLLYNTSINSMPDNVFASAFGFKEKEYFKATEGEKEAVKVKIGEK
jgi:LemA protein